MSTTVIAATKDASTTPDYPTTTFGSDQLGAGDNSSFWSVGLISAVRAYLYFDLSTLSGATVSAATLTVFGYHMYRTFYDGTLQIAKATADFTESTITHNTGRPSVGASIASISLPNTYPSPQKLTPQSFTSSDFASAVQASAGSYLVLCLYGSGDSSGLNFRHREYGTAAQLNITYTSGATNQSAANLSTAAGTASNGTAVTGGSALSSSATDFYVTGSTLSGPASTGYYTTATINITLSGGARCSYLRQAANYTVTKSQGYASITKYDTYFTAFFATSSPSTCSFYITWNDAYNGAVGNSATIYINTP